MVNKSAIVSKDITTSKQLESWMEKQIPQLNLVGKSNNIKEALKLLKHVQLQLVFVNFQDINTENFLQLQYLDKPTYSIVFVSPGFVDERFISPQSTLNQKLTKPNSIKIKIDGETKCISILKIIRLKACSSYTSIYTTEREQPIFTSKTLKFYANQLDNETFVRPHKSHIVNRNFIQELVLKPSPFLLLKDDTKIDIARRRLKAIRKLLSLLCYTMWTLRG